MDDQISNSYKSIVKATGVFGMMQVIKMIISIVSSKFVAIFLGPIGIGLVSLLTNALNIIIAITNFEFLKIATREIVLNYDEKDSSKLLKTLSLLQKMALVIGLLSAFIVIIFSRTLSYYTFGDYSRQYWFIWLSIYLFIFSLSNFRMAILQGVNKIKNLAWCNIVITFFTTIGSIIIYYFLRKEGIIWVLIYSSFVMLAVTLYFTRKFAVSIFPINFRAFYIQSNPIFKLGFFMSLNVIFGQICIFIIKLYLNNNGASSEILGYYQVSSVILLNYLGLIFNSMGYDFYPKLTAINLDNTKVRNLVNYQIEIAIIIVTPAILFLYLTNTYFIKLLYTKAFLEAAIIIKYALFSVLIKSIVFPMAYIILAKGNKMQFLKQELFSDFFNVFITILMYSILGLKGIGIAYIIDFSIYTIYVYYIVNKHYDFYFIKSCKKLILINLIFGSIALTTNYIDHLLIKNTLLMFLLLLSMIYSYNELNKRLDLRGLIKSKLKRGSN